VPEAGEFVRVVENDRTARSLAGEKAHRIKTESLARRGGKKFSLEDIFDRERGALVNELNLVLKADVSGSLEAFQRESKGKQEKKERTARPAPTNKRKNMDTNPEKGHEYRKKRKGMKNENEKKGVGK